MLVNKEEAPQLPWEGSCGGGGTSWEAEAAPSWGRALPAHARLKEDSFSSFTLPHAWDLSGLRGGCPPRVCVIG